MHLHLVSIATDVTTVTPFKPLMVYVLNLKRLCHTCVNYLKDVHASHLMTDNEKEYIGFISMDMSWVITY